VALIFERVVTTRPGQTAAAPPSPESSASRKVGESTPLRGPCKHLQGPQFDDLWRLYAYGLSLSSNMARHETAMRFDATIEGVGLEIRRLITDGRLREVAVLQKFPVLP
jgi:hypothetical protein